MNTGLEIKLIDDKKHNRQCGSCTACCDGWLETTINGEVVNVGKPCRHSTKKGCAIYETRPQSPCREFFCGWTHPDTTLPDWMRPNECGAIVYIWYEFRYWVVINAIPVGDRIPKRTLDWLMAYAKEQRRPLMFVEHIRKGKKFVGSRWKGFGPPAFAKEIEQIKLAREKAHLLEMFSPDRSNPDAGVSSNQ